IQLPKIAVRDWVSRDESNRSTDMFAGLFVLLLADQRHPECQLRLKKTGICTDGAAVTADRLRHASAVLLKHSQSKEHLAVIRFEFQGLLIVVDRQIPAARLLIQLR